MNSTQRRSTSLALASFACLARAASAVAAAPAESNAAAAAESPSAGLPVAIAVLVLGAAMLVALLVIIGTRSMRSSVGRLARSDRSPRRGEGSSTDAWQEAGRRHPVPPREGEASDEDASGDRFG